MSTPMFTIVIPTRDRPGDLDACLRSVADADNGQLAEVIVVDDAPQVPCRPGPVLTGVPLTVIRHKQRTGPDQSRNDGVRAGSGDYIGFLDDDARVPYDWFAVACAAIDDGMRAFTGRVLPFDTGLVSRARQWRYDERYARLVTGQSVGFLAGGNSVVARELFLRTGGFHVVSAGGDNGLVPRLAELGVPCQFVRKLRILHRNGKGFPTAAQQAWRAGRSAPAVPVPDTVRECAGALVRLRAAPLDVGVVNSALQLCHTVGRLTRRVAVEPNATQPNRNEGEPMTPDAPVPDDVTAVASVPDEIPAATLAPDDLASYEFAGLHHVQLAIPAGGEELARRYYGDTLGMTELEKPPVLAARGGCWFRRDGLEIHLGVEKDFRAAAKAHPGILVRDLDGLAARLKAAGADVEWDGNFPGHRRFYSHDLHGNRLELLEPDGA